MGIGRSFTARITRWRRRESDGAQTDGATEETASARWQRIGTIDDEAVFGEPSQRSRIRHDAAGPAADPLAVAMVQALWERFFLSFREDERNFERQRFEEAAAAVQDELDLLQPGEAPAPTLVRRMLHLLDRFGAERFASWNDRLEQLLLDHRQMQAELQSIKLASAWQVDELARCRQLIENALRTRCVTVVNKADGAPLTLSELICLLLGVSAPPERPPMRSRIRSTTAGDSDQEPAPAQPLGDPSPPQGVQALGPEAARARALTALVEGRATLARLHEALGNLPLAKRLLTLSAEHRRYEAVLGRVGLLPKQEKGQQAAEDNPAQQPAS